jgi:hypothetical protein
VFDPSGEVVAALALSVPDGDFRDVRVVVPMVRTAGRQISRALQVADAAVATDDGLGHVAALARLDADQHGRTAAAARDRDAPARLDFLIQ